MGKFKNIIAALFLFPSIGAAEQFWVADPSPPRFCMQNFNAYGPIYAKDISERTSRMNSELQAMPKCDVVHLQEVWNESQILQVENDLRRHYSFSSPNKDTRIGLMSLTKGDIVSTETHHFNVNNDGGVLDTARSLADVKKAFHIMRNQFFGIDEDLLFLNMHLHPSSQAVRVTQIIDILKWRLGNQDAKWIMTGDLNADPTSLEHRFVKYVLGMRDSLEEELKGYPRGVCTYCARNPRGWMLSDHVFDYIFYSNVGESRTQFKILNSFVNMRGTPLRPLSDHFGLRTNFSVDPEWTVVTESEMQIRLNEAIKVLVETKKVFATQKEPAFIEYHDLVDEMIQGLRQDNGVYNEYFKKFR